MSPVYRFGQFELDSDRRELRHDGVEVPIQPRPLDVLLYLACRSDRVVSRAELLKSLWPDARVNEEALGFAVHQARRAVGDSGTRQGVIRTIPRAGFRFVADLKGPCGEHLAGRQDFVGRSEALGVIDDALARAVADTRTTLMISGEPGIGKTRMAEHRSWSEWNKSTSVKEVNVG